MIANPRNLGSGVGLALCLAFTLAPSARADDAQGPNQPSPLWADDPQLLPPTGDGQLVTGDDEPDEPERRWVDSPYAPHDTTGANARLGSAVGRLVHDDRRYTALGLTIAGGPRMGRFTLEGHYTYLDLTAPGPSSERFGSAHRLGAMARADLVRLGSNIVGANSMLAVYGEAGLFHQLHRWTRPGVDDRPREVSVDGSRSGALVGFGLNLDVRLEQPRGFPARVGWQLGWQMTSSDEHDPGPTMICKGVSCLMSSTTTTRAPTRDTSMLVTSTIAFTW